MAARFPDHLQIILSILEKVVVGSVTRSVCTCKNASNNICYLTDSFQDGRGGNHMCLKKASHVGM